MLEPLHPCESILAAAHQDYLNPAKESRMILDNIMVSYKMYREEQTTPEILSEVREGYGD